MRRTFTYLSAALVFFVLMLTLFTPVRKVKADQPPEKCEACQLKNQEQFDKCLAKYGQDYIPCYDQFNEGIVHCFAHFCEQ